MLKDLWRNAMGTTIEAAGFAGMDFNNPPLGMQRIAEGFGARAERIEDLRAVGEIRSCALAHRGPSYGHRP